MNMISKREHVTLAAAAASVNDSGVELLEDLDALCSELVFHARSHTELCEPLDLLEDARDMIADVLDKVLHLKREATKLQVVRAPDEL